MTSTDRPSLAGAFKPAVRRQAGATVSPAAQATADPSVYVAGLPPAGRVHNVAVYLPVSLRGQVRERARARGLSITDLVEEAFAQHGSNWHELAAPPAHRPGSMPARSVPRRGHGTIQIQLRLDDRQHQWLDTQVERHDAPSRSALVAAVLSRHLGV